MAALRQVSSGLLERDSLRFVTDADRRLAHLRAHVRLARSFDLMTERQYEYLCRQMQDIGRQLGGWRKRLEQA